MKVLEMLLVSCTSGISVNSFNSVTGSVYRPLSVVENYSNGAKGATRFAANASHDYTPPCVAMGTWGACDVSVCCLRAPGPRNNPLP